MAEDDIPINLKFQSENDGYKEDKAFNEKIWKIIMTPPEWLKDCESIFKWGLSQEQFELVRWNIPDKLGDYTNQGAFYGFERLAFLLVFVFRKTMDEEAENILEYIWKKADRPKSEEESDSEEEESNSDVESEEEDPFEPEKAFEMCKQTVDEMAASEDDVMYSRIGPALQHCLQATRAHMLFFKRNIAESQELARNIQPTEEMSQECKAGFEGLKAKLIMSMVQNYEIVLPYLHKAMELDPGFGYWPYLTGKVLRRARREFDKDRLEEEFGYFKKAVSLERNPKFLVFLGQAYQEVALDLIHSNRPRDSVDRLLAKSVELYRECWSLKSDSAAIARRVGNGLLKMRTEQTDLTVAKQALLKAVELSRNNCTHISLGKFYYNHEKDDEKALEQFSKAHPGDFGTAEIIRLNLIKDPNYDPLDIMQVWLKLADNAVKQYRSFCDAVWYYLTFKRDVLSAANYLWRVLEEDDKFIRAKRAVNYISYAFCVGKPINLIELTVNEILLVKEQNQSQSLKPQDMKLLESILQKLLEKYPDCNTTPRPNMLEHLKREVDEKISSKRKWRYGYNNRRRETKSLSEEPVNWRSGPHQDQQNHEHYGNRRPYNSENNRRYGMRNSFTVGDEDRRNRGFGDDRRRNSESEPGTSFARTSGMTQGTKDRTEPNSRFSNRGRNDRQYNNYNNNRYDVTVTDWRSENRKH